MRHRYRITQTTDRITQQIDPSTQPIELKAEPVKISPREEGAEAKEGQRGSN